MPDRNHYENAEAEVTKHEIFQRLYYGDTPVLTYHIFYPQFSGAVFSKAFRKMNRYYRRVAATYQRHYQTVFYKMAVESYKITLHEGYPFHPYEADLVYEITLNQDCTLSLYFDRYEYTGGAHGNTIRFSDTWYLPLSRKLLLSELFPNNRQFRHNLLIAIIDEIQKNPSDYFQNFDEVTVDTFDPRNFYLSPQFLNIYFQQYEIAPYSTGIPVFSIPYERVGATRPTCQDE